MLLILLLFVGNALDDLNLDDINVEASLNRELINDSVAANSSISGMSSSSKFLSVSWFSVIIQQIN